MRISVAMAVYNGERYIIEQMDSIRCQTRTVDEVIISDDFSTDNTEKIVNAYIDKYQLKDSWKYHKNSNSKGVAGNFYNAISETSGDIVVLCDQDDVWLNTKIQVLEEIFLKHPEVGCINSSFDYIDRQGKTFQVNTSKETSNNGLILQRVEKDALINIPLCVVFEKNISPGMTMAIRREIVNSYLRVSKKTIIHDWEINCISAGQNRLFFLNKVLVYYRIHEMQTVSIGNIKKRTRKEILKEKIGKAEETVAIRKVLLEELSMLDLHNNDRYIKKQIDLNQVREKVLKGRLSINIIKEFCLFVELWIKYRTIDFRYFVIDLLKIMSGSRC